MLSIARDKVSWFFGRPTLYTLPGDGVRSTSGPRMPTSRIQLEVELSSSLNSIHADQILHNSYHLTYKPNIKIPERIHSPYRQPNSNEVEGLGRKGRPFDGKSRGLFGSPSTNFFAVNEGFMCQRAKGPKCQSSKRIDTSSNKQPGPSGNLPYSKKGRGPRLGCPSSSSVKEEAEEGIGDSCEVVVPAPEVFEEFRKAVTIPGDEARKCRSLSVAFRTERRPDQRNKQSSFRKLPAHMSICSRRDQPDMH
jgi:hypothetical protein